MLLHADAFLLTTGITFIAVFLFLKFPFGNIDGRSVIIDKHHQDFKGAAGLPIRPRLSPSFTAERIREMFPVMVEICGKIDEFWAGVEQPQELEVKDLVGQLMTDIIERCIFGFVCNVLLDATDELRKMGKQEFVVPRFSGLTTNVIQSWKSASRVGIEGTLDDVSTILLKLICEIADYRVENEIDIRDLVDLLNWIKNLPENQQLTVEEAQSINFCLAGFENAGSALALTLYELALNPDIQCIGDILAVMDQLKDYILTKLTYLEQVLNESLRKYPPVPVMTRISTENYSVLNTNFVLPKGSSVLVKVYSIHFDAEHVPDPDWFWFEPERFSEKGIVSESNGAFLAFGASRGRTIVCLAPRCHQIWSLTAKTRRPIFKRVYKF